MMTGSILYFEDGIEFVRDKEGLYDLIIVDSTDPIGDREKGFYHGIL